MADEKVNVSPEESKTSEARKRQFKQRLVREESLCQTIRV